jgi:hypothetical protein
MTLYPATMRMGPAVVIMTMLALRCQHSELRYLERDVSAAELVGEWVATPETIRMLRDEWKLTEHTDSTSNQITLRADGTCLVRTYVGPALPTYYSLDEACRWKLEKTGHQHIMFSGGRSAGGFLSFYLGTTSGGELAIWQYADDPDQWRYIEYVNARETPSQRVNTAAQTLPRELQVTSAEREVSSGIHVRIMKPSAEKAERFRPGDVILFTVTAYVGSLTTVATSAEESRWEEAPRSWRLALADMSIGEVRRVWVCDPEDKKEWGDLAKEPCVVADYELVRVAQTRASTPNCCVSGRCSDPGD